MRIRPKLTLLLLLLLSLGFSAQVRAQNIKFGQSFDKTGKLVKPGDEFAFAPPQTFLAVKMVARAPLPIDTLFLIVKDINGVAGRYYMKRSRSRMDANAVIRIKSDGIYRVYIYNPLKRIRPVGFATVFVTSSAYPKKADLVERQRLILVERGVIKDRKSPDVTTASTETAPVEPNAEAEAAADLAELDEDIDLLDLDEGEDALAELDVDELDLDLDGEADDLLGETEVMPDDDLTGEFESFEDLEAEFDFDLDDF